MSAWVISGHLQCEKACPLYPQKQTLTDTSAPVFHPLICLTVHALAKINFICLRIALPHYQGIARQPQVRKAPNCVNRSTQLSN